MQLLPRYLVKNRIDVVADLAGFIVEYRPVYRRQIQIYRGINNVVEFRVLNADQKPIDILNYTPKFLAYDECRNLVLEYDGTVLDDGSTICNRGVFTVNISENDLLDLGQQYLSYNIYLVDNEGMNVLTYSDSHFGNDGTIRIGEEVFPSPRKSKVVTTFNLENLDTYDDRVESYYISSAIASDPGINNNNALHTIAVYTNNYIGDVTVQATLDNQIQTFTNWADVTTLNFDGSEGEPVPASFTGVYSFLRFKTSEDPEDTITKILVRN